MNDDKTIDPPEWEDIERAALHCPILHAAVHHVRTRMLTREQALTAAALALSTARIELLADATKALMTAPARGFTAMDGTRFEPRSWHAEDTGKR